MPDERLDLPSASGAERYDLCRASFLMERSVGEQDNDTTEADMGTRIHARLAGEGIDLTAEEEAIAEKARDIEARAIAEHFQTPRMHQVREERLWYRDPITLSRLWSGKPDLVAWADGTRRGMVLDYKSLWGKHTEAPSNLQLRALAVLAASEYGLDEIRVVLVQPNGWPHYTVADYGPEDLIRAESEIAALMEEVKRPGNTRTPHPKACRFCKARANCPEALASMTAVSTLPREGNAIALTAEQIAEFLDRIPMVESVIEAVRGKAKRLLAVDPNAIPGWHLKPGVGRTEITDIPKVFARFVEAGGTQEQFTGAVSITKTALLNTLRTATGLKGKALNAKLDEVIDGCVTTTTTAASIEKGPAR